MIYKIVHGLVAIPLPPYFEQPARMTRYNHPLGLRQIQQLPIITRIPSFLCILEQYTFLCCHTASVRRCGLRTTKSIQSTKPVFRLFLTSVHDLFIFHKLCGERGGSVVECRTPEREVGGSKPTAAVLCP